MDDTYDARKMESILDCYEETDPDYYEKLVELIIPMVTSRLHGNYEIARHIYDNDLDEKVFNNAFRLSVKYNDDYQYNLIEAYFDFVVKAFFDQIVSVDRRNEMLTVDTNIVVVKDHIHSESDFFDSGRAEVDTIEYIEPENKDVDLQFNDAEYFSDEVFRNWSPV